MTKRFTKKSKRSERHGTDRRRRRINREMEGLDSLLGLASFIREAEANSLVKEAAPQKRCLGRAAMHVAIAQYIKYQQLQPSTPSTTS